MHQVVFVCAANVCRSPLMAFLFSSSFGPDSPDWSISSAGVHADRTRSMCRRVVALLRAEGVPVDALGGHNSNPVEIQRLLDADLVVVASRTERAAVAKAVPEARRKTFTLLEAIALGDLEITPGELEASRESDTAIDPVAAYVRILNGRRGLAVERPTPRRFSRRHPWDISDGHNQSSRAHDSTIRVTADATRLLAERLRRFIDRFEHSGVRPPTPDDYSGLPSVPEQPFTAAFDVAEVEPGLVIPVATGELANENQGSDGEDLAAADPGQEAPLVEQTAAQTLQPVNLVAITETEPDN